MTYNLCKKLIALGKLEAKMLDVYYAAGRLDEAQYIELMSMLDKGE